MYRHEGLIVRGTIVKICIFLGVLFFSLSIFAVEDYAATPAEAEMCTKRVYSRKDPKNPDWGHMHHYCDGLRFYQRAMRDRSNPAGFKFNINNATTNYNYVLTHTSPGFHMRPEVMVMKGQLLELASKTLEASQLYNEAIRLNPKFAMAYGALGNFYAKTGSKDQALKVYTEGLKRNPRNRYLLARYKALGGRSAEISQ